MIDPEMLLGAYRMGAFPMADETGEILWFSPDPRGILPLETFHVPHGLKSTLRKGKFEVRVNSAFGEVIRACSQRAETWISTEIMASYCHLHRLGYAHSVESWLDGRLVGGLYGVALGGAFFGESMFSNETDASKVALVALADRLRRNGYQLLDTQWMTDHLRQFGGIEIARLDYLERLEAALEVEIDFAQEYLE